MFRLFAKFRFLPATIFVAVLMLTVRIGNIWNSFDSGQGSGLSVVGALAVGDARAQEQGAGKNQPPAQQNAKNSKDSKDSKPKDKTSASTSALITSDPTLLTQTEIDLLQQLEKRRRSLDSRESKVAMREGLLLAAEVRIDKKVEELKQYQATIKKLVKTYNNQQGEKIQSLVKIYENMKPKDAARIFEELEMNTLLLVVERMKERKLAPIMARMNPGKATEITVDLAKLRKLPNDKTKAGG